MKGGVLFRWVARTYLAAFGAALAALLVVYAIGDFADRLNAYLDKPAAAVAELYANKAVVFLRQLIPAAMLLAAAACASTMRRRGEWTALMALGRSRAVLVAPILTCCLGLAVGAVALDEWGVGRAGPRVDELMVQTFNRWGDYRQFYFPHRWLRLGDALVAVRGERRDGGRALRGVTILTLDGAFRVVRRVEADRLDSAGGDAWTATGVRVEAYSSDGALETRALASMPVRLVGSTPATFAPSVGRPEYTGVAQLVRLASNPAERAATRVRARLALHERFAYPLTGVAAAVLVLVMTLSPSRGGQLTTALLESLGVTMGLFAMLLVGRALALGSHVAPAVATWTPPLLLLAAAGWLWRRAERPLSPLGHGAGARAGTR